MDSKAPSEIRRLLREVRKREEHQRQRRLAKKRLEARERAEHLRRAAPLVRRARAWARAFAREQRLPEYGIEVFRREGRRAEVTPSGRLVFRSWAKYFGWPEQHLEYVPIDFIEALADAIESGAVWEHVERALKSSGLDADEHPVRSVLGAGETASEGAARRGCCDASGEELPGRARELGRPTAQRSR